MLVVMEEDGGRGGRSESDPEPASSESKRRTREVSTGLDRYTTGLVKKRVFT